MNRRHFVSSTALATAASTSLAPTASAAKPKRALMEMGATVFGGFGEGGPRRG